MKSITVPFLPFLDAHSSIEQISSTLDNMMRHPIDEISWSEFRYKPEVYFSIAHIEKSILLKYYVTEDVVKAGYFKPNDPVYKDSCVELFIAFGDERDYYNIEFNPIGTCKLNFGEHRDGRVLISDEAISRIRFGCTISNEVLQDKNKIHWEFTVMIPANVFCDDNITGFSGKRCRANFFKCGDDLPVPHFLSWSRIESPSPDFHRPDYFGEIIFE